MAGRIKKDSKIDANEKLARLLDLVNVALSDEYAGVSLVEAYMGDTTVKEEKTLL